MSVHNDNVATHMTNDASDRQSAVSSQWHASASDQ
jgi:hypothetical protein